MSQTTRDEGKGLAAPCPTALEIASFVDGALADATRARLLTHLADCDDCREVVATATAASPAVVAAGASIHTARPPAQGSWLRRSGAWAAAAALAAVTVLAIRLGTAPSTLPADAVTSSDVWADVSAAIGPARPLDARLSRLSAHVPIAPPTRAQASEASFGRQALAARLVEAVSVQSTDVETRRDLRHAAGVAVLVAGRAGEAIPLLESALVDASPTSSARADVLADLSAAFAQLGETTSGDHWTTALRAADEALANDPTHAAGRFNRALALERLHRTDEALAAWRDLAADAGTGAGWREEAAARAEALAR